MFCCSSFFSFVRILLSNILSVYYCTWTIFVNVTILRKYSGNGRACASSRYQAVFLLPHGLGTRLLRCGTAFAPHFIHTMTALLPVVFPHRFRSISAVLRSFRTVSAASPQSFHTVSAASPQCHGLSAASPQSFHTVSAASPQSVPLCFPVSPHCCRSPSAVFGCVNLSEKTVAETLSNQRLMYSAMVLLFNTLSVCSLLLMSPLPLFLEGL